MIGVAATQSLNCCNETRVPLPFLLKTTIPMIFFLYFVPQLNRKEKFKTFHVPVWASNKTDCESVSSPFQERVKISIFRSMFTFLVCCKTQFSVSFYGSLHTSHLSGLFYTLSVAAHGNKQTMVAETIPSAVWENTALAMGETRTLRNQRWSVEKKKIS